MAALFPFRLQADLVGAVLDDTKQESTAVIFGCGLSFIGKNEHVAAQLDHLSDVGIIFSHDQGYFKSCAKGDCLLG